MPTMYRLFLVTTLLAALFSAHMALANDLPITEKLTQKTDVTLETHIGGQIFKVKRTAPLPNAFGKADWFGRTVDRGYMEVRFHSYAPENIVVLRLVDVDTRTNETTMNRTQIETTTTSGELRKIPGTNSAQISGSSTTVRSSGQGTNELLPPNTTEIRLDLSKRKSIKLGSVTLRVEEADEASIRYVLSNAASEASK